MELWNYIQILGQKKQGWLFKKDNIEERLLALTKILEFGYPSSIQNLIPFLKDENKEIQHTTCNVITQLFKKIETKKGYYDTLLIKFMTQNQKYTLLGNYLRKYLSKLKT